MKSDNEIATLYSSQKDPLFEKYMSLLFPFDIEEYTNFGYWKNLPFPETIEDIPIRVASQRALYELVHASLHMHNGEKVLEIGCGKSYGVKNLYRRGIFCFGVDALKDQVRESKHRHKEIKDYIFHGAAESLPFKNETFDAIYSIEAAQHFPDFLKFANESRRVLNQTGKFYLTTFFLTSEKHRDEVCEIIPPTVEGIDQIVSIDFALDCLATAGFRTLSQEKIGIYIFPQFAKWQQITIQTLNFPTPPKEKLKWSRYYSMENTDKPHPWQEAFQKGLLDYFVIKNF